MGSAHERPRRVGRGRELTSMVTRGRKEGAPVSNTDEAAELTPDEASWVRTIRALLSDDLEGLCLAPDDWYQGMDLPSPEGRCLAWFDLVGDQSILLTVGAYFDGVHTVVGDLHNQLFLLTPTSRRARTETFSGPIEEQAARACNWFATVRRRPVERREWSLTVYEYRFADDGTGLSYSRDAGLRQGPPGKVVSIDTEVH